MDGDLKASHAEVNTVFSQLNYYLSSSFLVIVDYLSIACAVILAEQSRGLFMGVFYEEFSPLNLNDFYVYGVVPCIFLAFIAYADLYHKRLPLWQCIGELFKICLYVNLLAIIFTYFLGKAESISRLFMGSFWIFSFVNLCTFRYLAKKAFMKCGLWQIPVIIIGAGKTAEILAKTFEKDTGIGYKVFGVIEDQEKPMTKRYPNLGKFAEVEAIIAASGIKDVILATPGLEREDLVNLVCRVQPYVRNLTIIPDLFEMPMSNISADTLYNEKILLLHLKNNLARRRNRLLKRVFDLVSSIVGCIVISPLLIGIGIKIYISSPGAIIFAHMRIGNRGKEFPCYKFRSMVNNAQEILKKYLEENPIAKEEWEREFKLKNDPRVTKIGAFLRKTSLDELPQLINVIKGEMSLVGPRPIVEKEIEKYGQYIHDYYLVKPGMTGFWQVSGRSDVDYGQRVRMDAWYIRNWSLWQDIVILAKTVKVVLGKDGAY